jgi:hypothetical protein
MEGIPMTYLLKRPAQMSGFWDWLLESPTYNLPGTPTSEAQCVEAGNVVASPIDAKIADLSKSWNPSGLYTTADVRSLISETMKVVAQAQATLDQAASEPTASQESVLRATDDLARAGGRSLDYLQAASMADQRGIRVVNAAGLKGWVTDTLAAASSAVVTATAIGCIAPWWASALATFQSVFDRVWSVIRLIPGAVLAVGETVLKVANDIPDLYEIIKYAAVAGGLYWVWKTYLSDRRG